MYQILTDVKYLDRFDLDVDDYVLVSGYQGSWVTLDGSAQATLVSAAAGATALAYPVWTEEYRSGAQGFTPDTANTSKITVVSGKHRAYTDRYDHTTPPTLGVLLVVGPGTAADSIGSDSAGTSVNGMLVNDASAPAASHFPVAVCKRAPFLYTPVHGGTARYVIEIQVF